MIAGKNYDNTKTREEISRMPEVIEQMAISRITFLSFLFLFFLHIFLSLSL